MDDIYEKIEKYCEASVNQIRIEKDKIYLDKWLVGLAIKNSISGKFYFSGDVDYCSPLDANNLRDLADKLDELNGVEA